ncbi:hypothetical protein [Paracoccus sp. Ld10]|uniref:hypothetical protein n=1 Tax=Paracoccus sp. Ld10 TaxID=649158 RepID=UPI0038678421
MWLADPTATILSNSDAVLADSIGDDLRTQTPSVLHRRAIAAFWSAICGDWVVLDRIERHDPPRAQAVPARGSVSSCCRRRHAAATAVADNRCTRSSAEQRAHLPHLRAQHVGNI